MVALDAGRLACADSAFPRLSHNAVLAVIRDLAITAVDICVFAGYEHNPPETVARDPIAAADRIRRRLERLELAVSDVFAILGPTFETLAVNHPDASVRERSFESFEQIASFAAQLGSPGITILPGVAHPGVPLADSMRLAAVELERRAERADQLGLGLSIEPHYGSLADTPALALELLDHAPTLALTLDYSHFVFQGISQADVDVLIPRARHVHLRQAAPGVMQARAWEGAIDFPRLVASLQSAGYEGALALEYQYEEWLNCCRVDCISETAELRDLILRAQRNTVQLAREG
jgi:sugar phosphate isomerase/epimerase